MKHLSLLVLFVLISLPGFQTSTGFFNTKKLQGKEIKTKLPNFKLDTLLSGDYQKDFETWLKKNLGFRGKMIRTENELNYQLFNVLSSNAHTPLVLGKDNYLFEKTYLQARAPGSQLPKETVTNTVKKLVELKSLLKQLDIPLLIVLSPNKAVIYEDKIPRGWPVARENTNFQQFMAETKDTGLEIIDSTPLLKKTRANGMEVFAKGGTHWNYLSGCLVAKEIREHLVGKHGLLLGEMDCSNLKRRTKPRGTDRDILNLANLWSEEAFHEELFYPQSTLSPHATSDRATALVVGDSFTWTPLTYFNEQGTFGKRKFFYYYNTVEAAWLSERKDAPVRKVGLRKPLDRTAIDWKEDIFKRDVIIILANMSVVSQIGHGFVEDAIAQAKSVLSN